LTVSAWRGIEAKTRIGAGEYFGKFGMFLQLECKNLGESRAYELIAVAKGTKTAESIREETNTRKQAFREREALALSRQLHQQPNRGQRKHPHPVVETVVEPRNPFNPSPREPSIHAGWPVSGG